MGILRRTLIRFAWPVLLREDQMGELLARFSATEADSAWQFLRAVEALDSPQRKAQMFETCIEEMHHAALFARLARTRVVKMQSQDTLQRTVVLSDPAKLPGFLAYAHVSEDDINRDFAVLAQVSKDPEVKAAFDAIQADESLHEEGAEHLLDEVIASGSSKGWTVTAAYLRRVKANLQTLAGRVGDALAAVILGAAYLVLGWTVAGGCRARLDRAARSATAGSAGGTARAPARSMERQA